MKKNEILRISVSPTRNTQNQRSRVPKTPPKSTNNAPKAMLKPTQISNWFLHRFFIDFWSILGPLVAAFCTQNRLKWREPHFYQRSSILLGSFSSTEPLQRPQTVPKWTPNETKMDLKWNQNCSKLDPKWSETWTSSEPNSSRNYYKIKRSIDQNLNPNPDKRKQNRPKHR